MHAFTIDIELQFFFSVPVAALDVLYILIIVLVYLYRCRWEEKSK